MGRSGTLLELALLGLLKDEALYGYELRKRASTLLGTGVLSCGSVYPALSRLETAGAIAGERHSPSRTEALIEAPHGRVQSEKERPGSARRYYRITEEGCKLFLRLLAMRSSDADEDRAFVVRLHFADSLAQQDRVALLHRHRDALAERIARETQPISKRPFAFAAARRASRILKAELEWLDGQITSESTSASRPTTPGVVLANIPALPRN